MNFQQRVLALLLAMVTLLLLFIALFFHYFQFDTLKRQISSKALIQAREIASDPQLRAAVEHHNQDALQQQIARLQRLTDAAFIVVGDNHGIRLAHPNKHKIGLAMTGGDNRRALLQGLHYTSIRKGSIGWSVRGKSPIYSSTGNVVGVVSVGYLLSTVSADLWLNSLPFFIILGLILVCCVGASWLFAKHIKQQMYGMEPKDIATSHHLNESVLAAVYEGIVAVDHQGHILSVNQQALFLLGIVSSPAALKGSQIHQHITPADFFVGFNDQQDNKQDHKHKSSDSDRHASGISCNGETLIATRVAMMENGQQVGWVTSFRQRDKLSILTTQLSHIRQQTDNLRVLSHEYANKLSTVGGLIQMGQPEQALKAIRQESQQNQTLIDTVTTTFQPSVVAGLLLGKYSRAKELGLNLQFDPACQLSRNTPLEGDKLAAIIGNLLDNAFEATLKNPDSHRRISLFVSDANKKELVIEVSDNGIGIDEQVASSLFERGATTKSQANHGIGLHLVQQLVSSVDGTILLDDAEPCGTIFSIFIPNEKLPHHGSL